MAQFANLEGPYATWARTEREEFIQSLLATIKRWAGVRIAWAIEIDDWRNRSQLLKAFTLCSLACISSVSAWAKTCGYEKKILHIFGAGDEGWPDLGTAFRPEDFEAYGILHPTIQEKRDVVPLQAARILAHQTGTGRDKRRLEGDIAPYLDELHQTRGISSMLNRELLNWPEDVIRIAELEGSPLWGIPETPQENIIAVNLMGAKSYTMRIPKPLHLMFAARKIKGIEAP
jgi:hypothetical protein